MKASEQTQDVHDRKNGLGGLAIPDPVTVLYRDGVASHPLQAVEAFGLVVPGSPVRIPRVPDTPVEPTAERLTVLCDAFVAMAESHGFSLQNLITELATR